ncbi:hypothetical protein [Pedobacter polysacchareus]|uniref:hypothetical protein n=1 Tax=Pedobacter polysacchareus TaxID=2861973 RepID=UPI001C993627|nr:hypothetical protein [Pedobacter polysacchareus]
MDHFIFLIAAEHQLFQVIEAIDKYNIEADRMTLIIEDMGDDELVRKITENTKIGKVLVFKNWVFKDIFINPSKHRNFISYCKKVRNENNQILFFASHYNSDNTLIFLSLVKPTSFYIMDEGTASFTVSYLRSKANSDAFKLIMKSLLYGFVLRIPKSLIYFTKYNFQILSTDRIENYAPVKVLNPLSTFNDKAAIFLGTSVVEVGIMKEDMYLKYLNSVFHSFSGDNHYYYPHRKEAESKLNSIREIGFTVMKSQGPFENLFAELKVSPIRIGSFICTTVLDNISRTNVKVPDLIIYEFDLDYLLKDKYVYGQIAAMMKSNSRLTFVEI